MDLIIQYLFLLLTFEVRALLVTPNIVTDVLHVPKVVHPDYLSYERLKTVSKDKLMLAFCGHPSNWGDR